MPHVILSTNVQLPDEKVVVKKLSEASAQIIGKPERAFLIQYQYQPSLALAGTFDPAWMVQVYALGVISEEANHKFSAGYANFVSTELGLPADRGYITFFDPGYANWAAGGQTLADRDPKKQK